MRTAAGSALVLGFLAAAAAAAPPGEPAFRRIALSNEFFCEGASFADFDRDGHGDVVSGPYWWRGPDFGERREIYPPKPFDPLNYSDNFFAFPHDFDGDGFVDVLFVGFPGAEAYWCENPKGAAGHWKRHVAFPLVDNESPAFADLTGDGKKELVFHTGGRLGFASPDPLDPRKPWVFRPISEPLGLQRFTHGLGVGDVNGDGRADVLLKDGWWEQPASLAGDPVASATPFTPWKKHAFPFSDRVGGAQMLVTDVDGDGDADVITSLNAHGFGLAWCEQVKGADGAPTFRSHLLMDDTPEKSRHGLVFSELHALALADVNADGLLDLVTGKRYWAHGPDGGPDGRQPGVLYWFELKRGKGGEVDFVPHKIDDASGVGTQVVAGDVDGDGKCDVVVGNKQGTFVFLQESAGAERRETGMLPVGADGKPLNLDFEKGTLEDWTATGDAFLGQPVKGDTVVRRVPGVESRHQGDFWIGGYELSQDRPTGTLSSKPFRVTQPFASFLADGGSHDSTRVEIVRAADGKTIFKTSGADYETLQRVVVDLRAHAGAEVFVRLVDEQPGGWGHVNFDDFRLHAEKPVFPVDESLPPMLPLDPVAHAGLAPADAAKAMTVPDGFRVELVASEPDLRQPVTFAIDGKARLWVVEAHSYPKKRPAGEGQDSILVFEDADRDGSFEKRTVFAEGLNLVSGLEIGFGGVFVGAAPELLFIADRDGDLKPDGPPETLLDGWGYQDTHETLNAFIWGPDGWLYGCHGVFTHSKVGKPGTPDAERVPLNAAVWRYHPTRREFEVFAEGTSNPWGVDFDDDGEAFISACVIPHLYHVIPGARYERQAGSAFNAHTYDDIKTIADHRHYLGSWPHGGNLRSNAAGGGHAHCGALVYLGDTFPERYRNSIFMFNIHGNRINNDLLVREGSGFVGKHGEDFLLANDKWFRGVSLKTGPDGSVYFIDWCDQQACHDNTPERWDRTNGRLYRVGYGEPRKPAGIDLAAMTDEELVALHSSRNDWWVRGARRVLQERGPNEPVHAALRSMAAGDADPTRRLRALWTLHATGGLTESFATDALSSPFESVAAWAVRLIVERRSAPPGVLARFAAMARETKSARVRLALASALQRLPLDDRWAIAEGLAARGEDERDRNIPLMVWYGVEPLVPSDPARALALAKSSKLSVVARFVVRRAASEPACHEALVAALAAEEDAARLEASLAAAADALRETRGLAAPAGWPALYERVSRDGGAAAREHALRVAVAFGDRNVFPELRKILSDAAAPEEKRRMALDALVAGADREAVPGIERLLDDAAFRGAALRALAAFDDPSVPGAILARYGALGDAERRDALSTLAARPANARALLDAVADGRVPRAHLGAVVLRSLSNLRDPAIDARVASEWGLVRATPEEKRKRIDALRKKLSDGVLAKADLAHGREVFVRTCSQCHTLFGAGGSVGPDITGSNRADVAYLLENLVDPNALIGKDYQVTVVRTRDERVVTGILKRTTDTALVLQTENDTVVVPLSDVEESAASDVSMMPENQLDTLAETEVRDLVAYLRTGEQVPLRATPGNVSRFFDGKTLAGWTGNAEVWRVEEGGEIVGRTETGLARNEFLRSDLELGDFRLTLEVKLVKNEGNSGIQFRSRATENGDVAGYQADIGPGWWGKLYEEHGRAVLSDKSGEPHVKPGEWNRYEIVAVGHRVKTFLNGEPCVDLDDPEGAERGIVALQVHSGGPTEVRFRNLKLELDPKL